MFHRIDFRVHVHATEEEDRVLQAFTFLSGIDRPEIIRAEGYHGNPIAIITGSVREPGRIKDFWKKVKEAGELEAVLRDLDRRVDDECVLHMRLDKQEAYSGRIKVARHDDVISVRAKVAAYPARRDTAIRAAKEYLEGV